MSFSVNTEILGNGVKLTLEGELDSFTAPKLNEEVQKLVLLKPDEMVFDFEKLNFMSSSGLRIIIFARQHLGANTRIILLKPQEQVVETLKITGLISIVSIMDKYPE